jgi:carbon-monoxide dehydrogenase large subunit
MTLPRVVADTLGCSPQAVELVESDNATALVGSGSFGSRSLTAMGTALVDAARRARRELLAVAAESHGRPVERLDVVAGQVVDGAEALGDLADVVAIATQGGSLLEVRGTAPRFTTFPSGCHVAEVEIDPDTGAVTLIDYTAVDDSGVVVDHAIVEGQIRGGVVQGIGEALSEAVVYGGEDGQLLTACFVDYAVPRANDVPAIDVADAGVASPTNPIGAKGVGEAGTTGAPAAVANAVMDALRRAGAPTIDMPFTAARVWTALHRPE